MSSQVDKIIWDKIRALETRCDKLEAQVKELEAKVSGLQHSTSELDSRTVGLMTFGGPLNV